MKRVFHFSGGHTSGLMVLKYYRPGDIVIFCDTGREHPGTYLFVRNFIERTGIPVIILTGDWRREVIVKERMIPNYFKRKCTLNLKIKKARRYLRSIGLNSYIQFIGFRKDEKVRVDGYFNRWKKVVTEFPLYEDGTTSEDVNSYWFPVSWKLSIPKILGNCTLCFQKGESAIMAIIKADPSLADVWIEDEENREINPKGYTYFKGKTIRQLKEAALQLKGDYDLNNVTAKFSCACTA